MKIMREILENFVRWTKLKVRLHVTEKDIYFYEREIWWASLGVNIGYEQDGKNENFERPILVLKKFNQHVFWAMALTSRNKKGRYYFETEYEGEKFNIILSQLKLTSSKRLQRKIRTLPEEEFNKLRERIKSLI